MTTPNQRRFTRSTLVFLFVILVVPFVVCSGSAWLVAGPQMGYVVVTVFGCLFLLALVSGVLTWLILRSRKVAKPLLDDREDDTPRGDALP